MNYTKELLLSQKNFQNILKSIYNVSVDESLDRIINLLNEHNKEDVRLFSSPGRIEICGNHTDHNNGKVLCASVSIDTLACVTPTNDNKITVNSLGYPLVVIDLTDLNVKPEEKDTSMALVRGVAKGFTDRGYKIGGFHATTTSNVFKGAGVSSSAAFEVLTSEIFNVLYNDSKIGKVEKAIISQYAENVYFGKPSGLMDQSAISLGGVSYIDFEDTKNPIVENMKWTFTDCSVVIVNCGGDHSNLTPQYAAIREEMETVAKFFDKEKLRFVDEGEFYEAMPRLYQNVSGRAILRAVHYFEENKRVDELKKAIINKEEEKALKLISASGESSYKFLQNCYPEGDPSQNVPLGLFCASKFDGVKAYRVHGGGFAGTILTFVKNERAEAFGKFMADIFGKKNIFVLQIRDDGAREILKL